MGVTSAWNGVGDGDCIARADGSASPRAAPLWAAEAGGKAAPMTAPGVAVTADGATASAIDADAPTGTRPGVTRARTRGSDGGAGVPGTAVGGGTAHATVTAEAPPPSPSHMCVTSATALYGVAGPTDGAAAVRPVHAPVRENVGRNSDGVSGSSADGPSPSSMDTSPSAMSIDAVTAGGTACTVQSNTLALCSVCVTERHCARRLLSVAGTADASCSLGRG
jgi:hypothetical protein